MIQVTLGNTSIKAESQARLNDTKWHLFLLEIHSDEIRLAIDGYNTFKEINTSDIFDGKLLLNDNESYTGVYTNCEDRCSANFCQNAAECVEDFEDDTVVCRCRYPNVQSGRNCEIDINQNSSVSFSGGFLKYELSSNPLVNQTVLSFRSDQPHALLLFVHDHNNNFLQLHLSDEVNITLSLNNEAIVSSCTVTARLGSEFSNMQWIQMELMKYERVALHNNYDSEAYKFIIRSFITCQSYYPFC
ncbi:hypothetical protein DICVIV_05727 [Dictyocaulus viviparus]|uniref:EGF-like domain-containing protein n=1 Tax=Dictyocaulus viviparus TaxID=29172 RepID=A0A0D8XU51_DICVI|nr:hypothetical protein DICVIV_05727 [Dictyocaulus viviparus]